MRNFRSSCRSINTYSRKYELNEGNYTGPIKNKYDAIIIGGGHNGLICANYLAKSGLEVLLLERRYKVGGCSVTEEIFPGFKFSRASYLAGLLRPYIIKELELEKYGFKYLLRDPSSFTPTKDEKYLLLGNSPRDNFSSISQFSVKDANNYIKYEEFLSSVRDIITPILDSHPPSLFDNNSSYYERLYSLKTISLLMKQIFRNRDKLSNIYEFFTAPSQHFLDQWFESHILKTTLATDSVIGYLGSPQHNGSAYVLLHHIMGEVSGRKGVWAYIEGGMGKISECLEQSAKDKKVEIINNAQVKNIIYDNKHKVTGVKLFDDSTISSNIVVSATTPYHTFTELMNSKEVLPENIKSFHERIEKSDYTCASMKINCVVKELPNFTCFPSPTSGHGPMHTGTIHFETEMNEIITAYQEASMGIPANKPVIEMTIPSTLDKTLVSQPYRDQGYHIVQLFIQFVPYTINSNIGSWQDETFKNSYALKCFDVIDQYCPNFSKSLANYEVLSPLDLEYIFGLHQGSIMHGSIGLHQLGYARPIPGYSNYRTPYKNLYLASAGTHPGGGVMGACGKNCARVILSDLGKYLG